MRWHGLLCVAVLTAVLLAGGCGRGGGVGGWYRIDPLVTSNPITDIDTSGRINPYTYQFAEQRAVAPGRPGSDNPLQMQFLAAAGRRKAARDFGVALAADKDLDTSSHLYATAYEAALHDHNYRNRLQNVLITRSDQIAARHLSDIIGTQNFNELALGTTSLATSTVATIASPVTAKILSAISAVSTGTREAVRQVIYNNLLGIAIVNKILLDREAARAAMASRQAEALEQYPVDVAIADAVAYHQLGSFYEGVVRLTRDISTSAGKPFPQGFAPPPQTAEIKAPNEITVTAGDGAVSGVLTLDFSRTDSRPYVLAISPVLDASAEAAFDKIAARRGKAADGVALFDLKSHENGIRIKVSAPAAEKNLTLRLADDKGNQLSVLTVKMIRK